LGNSVGEKAEKGEATFRYVDDLSDQFFKEYLSQCSVTVKKQKEHLACKNLFQLFPKFMFWRSGSTCGNSRTDRL